MSVWGFSHRPLGPELSCGGGDQAAPCDMKHLALSRRLIPLCPLPPRFAVQVKLQHARLDGSALYEMWRALACPAEPSPAQLEALGDPPPRVVGREKAEVRLRKLLQWARRAPHAIKTQLYEYKLFIHTWPVGKADNDEALREAAFGFFFRNDVLGLRGARWERRATVSTDGVSASLLYEVRLRRSCASHHARVRGDMLALFVEAPDDALRFFALACSFLQPVLLQLVRLLRLLPPRSPTLHRWWRLRRLWRWRLPLWRLARRRSLLRPLWSLERWPLEWHRLPPRSPTLRLWWRRRRLRHLWPRRPPLWRLESRQRLEVSRRPGLRRLEGPRQRPPTRQYRLHAMRCSLSRDQRRPGFRRQGCRRLRRPRRPGCPQR